MKKYDYQTCLRLPIVLKDEMTTICDEYHINESDLMRKAIVQFVQTINSNPQDNGKLMFVWLEGIFVFHGYPSDITSLKDPVFLYCRVFFVEIGWSLKRVRETCIWGVSYLRCIDFSPWPQRIFTGTSTQTTHPPHFLLDFPYETSDCHSLSNIFHIYYWICECSDVWKRWNHVE